MKSIKPKLNPLKPKEYKLVLKPKWYNNLDLQIYLIIILIGIILFITAWYKL